MAEWYRAPAVPPREGGATGSDPGKAGFGIDSFFDLFFHIVQVFAAMRGYTWV